MEEGYGHKLKNLSANKLNPTKHSTNPNEIHLGYKNISTYSWIGKLILSISTLAKWYTDST